MSGAEHGRPSVVVPTYDERETIEQLLGQLLEDERGYQVLVVDDGSPDGTGELVAALAATEPRIRLLQRERKSGLGDAYRAGFQVALGTDATVICQMDADLSHDPRALGALVDAVAGGADLAVGSRYVAGGDVTGWSWQRVALSRAANLFARAVTGCPVRDMTAGFRAWSATGLQRIEVATTRSQGYAFQIEMTLRARTAGLRIVERPIAFVERTAGRSKLTGAVGREALRMVLRWGWALRRGRPL